MPIWDFQRSISGMRLLTELAAEHGLPARHTLAGTGISEDQLHSPEAVVEARQELLLIRNLVDNLGDVPALGVCAGRRYHFTAYGALGFAMVSSQTLRDALDVGLKYIRLTFAFCHFELQDKGDHTHIIMGNPDLPDNLPDKVRQFVVERDSSAVIILQRDIFDMPGLLEKMRFSFANPGHSETYESFYQVTPEFNVQTNEAILNRERLLQRLPQANELALSAAQQQCETLLNQRRERSGLAAQVRTYLARRAADMPSMEQAAQALHMIPRTLRRRLLDEDTRFAELRDEVRQILAEEYLSGPGLSVEQVADRLGYAEATSFINAYKRWYGATPSAYRRQYSTGEPVARR